MRASDVVKGLVAPGLEHAVGLDLADGSTWGIVAGDASASFVVSPLAEAMQLRPVVSGVERPGHGRARRLLVVVDRNRADLGADDGFADVLAAHAPVRSPHAGSEAPMPASWTAVLSEDEGTTICVLSSAKDARTLPLQLVQVSAVIGRHAQTRGGLLLHGALAEREGCGPSASSGQGVILAGPGGVGKTMASQRLLPPWRSLCDDTTLVVRDEQGAYWVHPWPTWSTFALGGPGGTWDVQRAVPLKGIFFLSQAEKTQLEPVGVGQAVTMLVESAEQVSWPMVGDMECEEIRAIHLQRFDNICALAQAVPCYILRLSLAGAFWQEMERALSGNGEGPV